MDKRGVSDPGRYVGIYSSGQLPYGVVYKELESEKKIHGRIVQYYHCWVRERKMKPVFNNDREPDRQKITLLTRFFRAVLWG